LERREAQRGRFRGARGPPKTWQCAPGDDAHVEARVDLHHGLRTGPYEIHPFPDAVAAEHEPRFGEVELEGDAARAPQRPDDDRLQRPPLALDIDDDGSRLVDLRAEG